MCHSLPAQATLQHQVGGGRSVIVFRCDSTRRRTGVVKRQHGVRLRAVPKVVVDVMLKPEIHDPQGEAIVGACHRLGFGEVRSVRQGKRFELELDDAGTGGATGTYEARVAELAAELLANPVIEEFAIHQH
jgi:phosphoribosylformylglycinamidine synthase subunit PurS